MTESDLSAKIAKSDAFASLSAECRVCAVLGRLGWTPVHASYYIDLTEHKPREIDVIGRQRWVRPLQTGDHEAELQLVAEVKSLRGQHILFAPASSQETPTTVFYQWLGYKGSNYERLASELRRAGVSAEQVRDVMAKFERIAYPQNKVCVHRLMVPPPPAEISVSGLRETNIGTSKECEQSVLWKSALALQSAIDGLSDARLAWHLSWVTGGLESALSQGKDPVGETMGWLDFHVRKLAIYHPVLVVAAHLWLKDGESAREIPWCRFQRLTPYGWSEWWFDVVRMEQFDDYALFVSDYYARQFGGVGAWPAEA